MKNVCIYMMTCQKARRSACWSSTVSAFMSESFGGDSLLPVSQLTKQTSQLTKQTSPFHMLKILPEIMKETLRVRIVTASNVNGIWGFSCLRNSHILYRSGRVNKYALY